MATTHGLGRPSDLDLNGPAKAASNVRHRLTFHRSPGAAAPTLGSLEHVQRSPTRSGIHGGCEACESSVGSGGGEDGAGVQPGPAGSGDRCGPVSPGCGGAVRDRGCDRDRLDAAGARGRADRPQAGSKRSKLDPHRDYLLGLIAAEPDTTIAEMQARLAREASVSASVGTIWTFLDRAGLTFKKRRPTPRSRSVRTS